jgi:hypothetical protein
VVGTVVETSSPQLAPWRVAVEPPAGIRQDSAPRRAAKKTRAGSCGQNGQKGHNRCMGRRSLLSDPLREWIEDQLAAGVAQVVIAQRAGVSTRSLRRWISTGQVRRPERPAPSEDDSWRIAASLLERAFPERWGADRAPRVEGSP